MNQIFSWPYASRKEVPSGYPKAQYNSVTVSAHFYDLYIIPIFSYPDKPDSTSEREYPAFS